MEHGENLFVYVMIMSHKKKCPCINRRVKKTQIVTKEREASGNLIPGLVLTEEEKRERVKQNEKKERQMIEQLKKLTTSTPDNKKEKQIKKIRKLLREIESLEKRLKQDGVVADKDQIVKLQRKPGLEKDLQQLLAEE